MRVLSCFKTLPPANPLTGGIGQGGGNWFTDVLGQKLQQCIAQELDAELTLHARPGGRDAFDCHDYDSPEGHYDVAYCQLFECPTKRPADFVWTCISDYIGEYGRYLEEFLRRVKPNLLISFQYPLDPPEMIPTCPHLGPLPDLVAQCGAYGCHVAFAPWFNEKNFPAFNPHKIHTAMSTGKMSGTYPWRDKVYKYLESLQRPDIVLSGNPHGSTFKLSDEEYRNSLASTRWYFTGGIYDLQVPPKYMEICNHGACLVTNEMPMLEDCGFIHGETCFVIHSLEEIPYLLQSDLWFLVARAGQQMVHERHGMAQRANDIAKLIQEMRA